MIPAVLLNLSTLFLLYRDKKNEIVAAPIIRNESTLMKITVPWICDLMFNCAKRLNDLHSLANLRIIAMSCSNPTINKKAQNKYEKRVRLSSTVSRFFAITTTFLLLDLYHSSSYSPR